MLEASMVVSKTNYILHILNNYILHIFLYIYALLLCYVFV